jgi:deazaflavin-dependent oxidoreductase (nitroreductase family)
MEGNTMSEKKTTIPPAVNAMMKFVLRSPLHGMASNTITVISFTGRKSGKTYSTPVSYSQNGSQVTIFTHGEWYKNLAAGAPVTLRIRGKDYTGQADVTVADKAAMAAGLTEHLKVVHSDAPFYHVTFDEAGNPKADEIEKAVNDVVMIRVTLK